MLIVIPVSRSDRKLIPLVERSFELFPPGAGHRLLVLGSPNVSQDVKELAQKLCIHFAGAAATYICDEDSHLGWPTACNYYFQQAAFFVRSFMAAEAPWLWFELDSTPLRADWLDAIESACISAQARAQRDGQERPLYFGVKERACLESGGDLMPIAEAGEQMAACGVYPGDMSKVLTLQTITATNIPWYTFIRWYVVPLMAQLPQIQNNWKTFGYERQPDGRITCKSQANWAWDIHFNADLRKETVLVHGCKDESLIKLLSEGYVAKTPAPSYWTDPRPEQAAQPAATPVEPKLGRPRKHPSTLSQKKRRGTPGSYWTPERCEARRLQMKEFWQRKRETAEAQ